MIERVTFLRRHFLWLGAVAVFVPLAAMLLLQYGWLVKLERTSAIARQAELSNYLAAVGTKIEYYYRNQAEKTLNVPSYAFVEKEKLYKAAHHFRKKAPAGARRLFVESFSRHSGVRFYDACCQSLTSEGSKEEWTAVSAAVSPWKMHAKKRKRFESMPLVVDETDPANRIVMNPITDEKGYVVGVAGMILDEKFFRKELLPEVLSESLPRFFGERDTAELAVTVLDPRGHLAWHHGDAAGYEPQASRAVPFVFTDWQMGLARNSTPEQWARSNFALNVGLSVLLAASLVTGVLLALRMASRAMYLARLKNDFVSNVSHELRTPLSSIRVFGEFLRLGRVDTAEKAGEYGEFIETESRRLTQLINNILDFSKIESGQKIYKFERTDVAQVVADTLRTFDVRLRHAGFNIVFRRTPGDYAARVDPDAITQAFSNLLDNAVKYSGEAREIEVAMRRDDGFVVLAVTDHGIGISQEEQSKIFERFHRVGSSLVHDVKGSGLGLAIVNHIMQAHAGKVVVESTPGQGSTFSIYLPSEAPPQHGTAEAPTVEPV